MTSISAQDVFDSSSSLSELPTAMQRLETQLLPNCATSCFIQHCADFATSCICTVKNAIDNCVLGRCAIAQAIYTRNMTETSCDTPVRNRTHEFNVMLFSITACTVVFVALRLGYKQFFSPLRRLSTEDWTVVAAVILGLPSAALTVFGLTAHGLGADLWGLQRADLTAFARYFYVVQVIYLLLMLLVKLALTFFYRSIFLGPRVRPLLTATAVLHVAVASAFAIAVVFQCLPIAYQWQKLDFVTNPDVSGRCLDINAAGWANAAISVASDILLLAIPLCQIRKLKLHWKKKLGAALMFLTGASVTVISFLRLASVRNYSSTTNPTWDHWEIVYWSTIEVEVGVICTCLPAMRLILVRLCPRVFGSEYGPPSRATFNRYSSSRPSRNNARHNVDYDDDDDDIESDAHHHHHGHGLGPHSPSSLSSKRASEPAVTALEMMAPVKPEATATNGLYNNWRSDDSQTTIESGGGGGHGIGGRGAVGHDVWHDQVPLHTTGKASSPEMRGEK